MAKLIRCWLCRTKVIEYTMSDKGYPYCESCYDALVNASIERTNNARDDQSRGEGLSESERIESGFRMMETDNN